MLHNAVGGFPFYLFCAEGLIPTVPKVRLFFYNQLREQQPSQQSFYLHYGNFSEFVNRVLLFAISHKKGLHTESFFGATKPVSRVLSCTVIYLAVMLPQRSSHL